MTANRLTSNKEYRVILAIAFAAFIFSIAGSIAYAIKADVKRSEFYKEQEANEAQHGYSFSGPYCTPDRHPQLLVSIVLLVGATFFSLCIAKKYVLSTLLTTASLTRFIHWFVETRDLFNAGVLDSVRGIDRIFYNSGFFDITVLFLISGLLFWQISILLRMLIKNTHRKIELP